MDTNQDIPGRGALLPLLLAVEEVLLASPDTRHTWRCVPTGRHLLVEAPHPQFPDAIGPACGFIVGEHAPERAARTTREAIAKWRIVRAEPVVRQYLARLDARNGDGVAA